MQDLITDLTDFVQKNKFHTKGPLSVALQLTRAFKERSFPISPDDFLTDGGGQVKGLGGQNLKKILKEYDITKVLAEEAGRTSRNSPANMKAYVAFLNELHEQGFSLDWNVIEGFWIRKVNEFFSAKPFKLSIDSSKSIRAVLKSLVEQALERQKKTPGTWCLGTVMQHLVGAKLEVILGFGNLRHNSSNANDADPSRTGDFELGNTTIHVTTNPSEALLDKCRRNLEADRKPIIITLDKGAAIAEGLADNIGLVNRIEVIDFLQFLTTNIHEHSAFQGSHHRTRIEELITAYNQIIDDVETDPSLKIELSLGK